MQRRRRGRRWPPDPRLGGARAGLRGDGSSAGFDVWGGSEAWLAARVPGKSGTNLYKVDLGTGAATLVGPIAHPHAITAIAVRP